MNQAYSMIISDESQKSVAANAGILGSNPMCGISQFEGAIYTKLMAIKVEAIMDTKEEITS